MSAKSWLCGGPDFGYAVHVVEVNNTFKLMLSGTSSTGPASNLMDYIDEKLARSQGELFARNLIDAVDAGFRFNNSMFLHDDGRAIHYSAALSADRSQEDFKNLLNKAAM